MSLCRGPSFIPTASKIDLFTKISNSTAEGPKVEAARWSKRGAASMQEGVVRKN